MSRKELAGKFCAADGSPYDRYVVIGTAGSGKSTLAGALASAVESRYVELDALHWLPDWRIRELKEFRAAVTKIVEGDRWVVDGNYSKVRDIVWARAEAVIWLDLPFHIVMTRIIRRSFERALSRRCLWGGCHTSFRRSFLSRDSVILWAAKTWRKKRRKYPVLLARPEHHHLDVFRVTAADLSNVEIRRS